MKSKNPLKIYIACSGKERDYALSFATKLTSKIGFKNIITSSWIYNYTPDAELSDNGKIVTAARDLAEVHASDVLILLANDEKVTGGKFIEVGAAIAYGKPIWLIGRRENVLMYHPQIEQFKNLEELLNEKFADRRESKKKGMDCDDSSFSTAL